MSKFILSDNDGEPLNITDKLNNNDPYDLYKPYTNNKNNNYTYNPHVPIGYYKSEKKNDPF